MPSPLAAENAVLELIARDASLPEILQATCALYEQQVAGALCSVQVTAGEVRYAAGTVTQRTSWSLSIKTAAGEAVGSYNVAFSDGRTPHGAELELIQRLARATAMAIERLATLATLRQSEERYRSIIDGLDDVVYQTDAEGRLTFVSPSLARATGLRPEQALGRELGELVHPEDRRRLDPALRDLLSGERASARAELRLRAGDKRWIDWHGRPLRDADGTPVGVAGILTDISERKTLEAQLLTADRMASLGQLVAGVAHEINNPLASVMLNLEFLSREIAAATADHDRRPLRSERLVEPLRAVVQGVDRVRDLVRNLKIFSRGDERRRLVDVRQVLESTVRMAQNEIRHRARVTRAFGEVPAVEANEANLGQVFLNLIINAAQAIPEGKIDEHEIRLVTRTDALGRAVVEVRDTGAGIAPAIMDRIFDPFFTTKPFGVGTGLGLSICQRLVTALGGDLSVESEVGAGSTFRVTLPRSDRVEAERPRTVPPLGAVRRGSILVIDDEPFIGEAVRRLVAPRHDVQAVSDAGEALARIRAGARYDVILCDLMMPRMSGAQLFEELSTVAPETAERMLFITGGAFTPAARAFVDQMPGRVIEKPFDLRELVQAVEDKIR